MRQIDGLRALQMRVARARSSACASPRLPAGLTAARRRRPHLRSAPRGRTDARPWRPDRSASAPCAADRPAGRCAAPARLRPGCEYLRRHRLAAVVSAATRPNLRPGSPRLRRDDARTTEHARVRDTAQHVPLEQPAVDRQRRGVAQRALVEGFLEATAPHRGQPSSAAEPPGVTVVEACTTETEADPSCPRENPLTVPAALSQTPTVSGFCTSN